MFDDIDQLLREVEREADELDEYLDYEKIDAANESTLSLPEKTRMTSSELIHPKDNVLKKTTIVSFPKASRFTSKTEEDVRDFLGRDDLINPKRVREEQRDLAFGKERRFKNSSPRPTCNPSSDYTPNYSSILPTPKSFTLAPARVEVASKQLPASPTRSSQGCIEKSVSLCSTASHLTSASTASTFSRSERFVASARGDNRPFLPQSEPGKGRAPLICPESKEALRAREAKRISEESCELKRAQLARLRDEKNQKLLIKNRDIHKPLNYPQDKHKNMLFRVFKALEELDKRKIGPGTYEVRTADWGERGCGVDYERELNTTEPRARIDLQIDREVGPGYYEPNINAVKPTIPGFKIVKEQEKELTIDEILARIDKRELLGPEYDPTKKKTIGGVINPPQDEKEIDLEDLKNGPGAYTPNYTQVEKRTDILGAKMPQLNSFNDRINEMDLAKKDAVDVDLDPVYDFIKRRIKGGVINTPTEIKAPPNIPDKELYPERWELYDRNVDPIKPNNEIGGKFASVDYAKFRLKEKEKELLRDYLNLANKQPAPGQYNILYDLLEEGIAIPNFDRYLERSKMLTKSQLMQMDVEGDVLILEPDRNKPKLADIKMDKITGREEKLKDDLTSEAILNPDIGLTKPSAPMLVNMDKATSRDPPGNHLVVDLSSSQLLYPNYTLQEKGPKVLVNYDKDQGRKVFEKETENLAGEEYIPEINYQQVLTRVKGVPVFGKKKEGKLVRGDNK